MQENWQRRPRVFKQVFGGRCIAPPEELLRVAVEEASAYARIAGKQGRHPLKVFIDKGQLTTNHLRHLPTKEDGSFEGWAARVRDQLGMGGRCCFYMSSIQSRSPLIFERYRQFTEGLFELTGLPPFKIDSDMFAGDYQETSFGVHKDEADNFAFVAVGTKRMLLWRYEDLLEYVQPGLDVRHLDFQLQLDDIAKIRDRAIVLEGEPGDLLYWPGYYWHSAEGTGSVSVTNNLAIYLTFSPLMEPLMARLGRSVFPHVEKNQPFTPYDPARRQALAADLPGGLRDVTRDVIGELKALVDGGLEREMELAWLEYVSSGGFQPVPPPAADVTLEEDRAVRLASHAGLVWRELSGGKIAVAANGHATCFPRSRGLADALQRILGGGVHRIGALLDEAVEEREGGDVVWSRDRMRELLRALVAKRALVAP